MFELVFEVECCMVFYYEVDIEFIFSFGGEVWYFGCYVGRVVCVVGVDWFVVVVVSIVKDFIWRKILNFVWFFLLFIIV